MYGLKRRPQRPPRPSTRPPPPPPHPSPHQSNSRPPTPGGLRAIRDHLGAARHRAPDKSVRPNGRCNDNQHITTGPQGTEDTGHHLPGVEPCPAPRIRGRWAPSPSNPPAPHTCTRNRPRAPQEARSPYTTLCTCTRSTAGSRPSGSSTGSPRTPPTPWHT